MKRARNKAKQVDNPLEKRGWSLDDILGFSKSENKQNRTGILNPGEEVSFADLQKKQPEAQEEKSEKAYIEPGINYAREIVQAEERAIGRENRELEGQLREIMAEIKKLADSSKELQIQFREIAVEQYSSTPGKYHKSFFSWLLSIVISARMRIEDSGTWLQAMHSKKKLREYGAMAKKHGTSFTLNNERTVATQVG